MMEDQWHQKNVCSTSCVLRPAPLATGRKQWAIVLIWPRYWRSLACVSICRFLKQWQPRDLRCIFTDSGTLCTVTSSFDKQWRIQDFPDAANAPAGSANDKSHCIWILVMLKNPVKNWSLALNPILPKTNTYRLPVPIDNPSLGPR